MSTPRGGLGSDAGGDEREPSLRLAVVADIRLYRDGLAEALSRRGFAVLVAVSASGVDRVVAASPDVVVVDLASESWVSVVHDLLDDGRAAVVALAVPEEEPSVLACVEAGVAGYLPRDGSLEDLVRIVRAVARGETLASPRMVARLFRRLADLAAEREEEAPAPRLTSRQAEIIDLIDSGLSNKEIASRLSIELSTVKNHVHNILEKLQVVGRREAAALARAAAA
jgi:two-component system nitrate/nitrite response regulator NarL